MRSFVSALAALYAGLVTFPNASSMLMFGFVSSRRSASSMSGSDTPSFLFQLRTDLRWPGLSPSHG